MIIDSHAHYNLSPLYESRDILSSDEYENIIINCVGTCSETSARAVEITKTYHNVFATVGLHPVYTDKEYDTSFLHQYTSGEVIAIGECGFDFYRNAKEIVYDVQRKVFEEQIVLACQKNLPLMIHTRSTRNTQDAYDEALMLLTQYSSQSGYAGAQIHFFAGNMETAKKFIDLGCVLSFTGPITYDNSMHEIIRMIPDTQILLETDAPYAAPVPYRGQTCASAYVSYVYDECARIKGTAREKLEEQLMLNFKTLYKHAYKKLS